MEEDISNQEQILDKNYVLIHGEEMSGKSSLGRHLFLHLVEKKSPVLHIDLEQISGMPKEKFFHDAYRQQFNGDYSLWKDQSDKTLILDNLSSAPNLLKFVKFSKDFFDRIIVISSSDIFDSFFRDEEIFADFYEMKIQPLTHVQQEKLIKKRLELSDHDKPIKHGQVDQIETHINSMLTHKIVPRYPFYILSILQAYEGYMPNNLSVTSYGHCYYVLILAKLKKAGISLDDEHINTCFNFAENLAFEIYKSTERDTGEFDFSQFVENYGKKYIPIQDSLLNRLKNSEYGIIKDNGGFRTSYMHYFFLGKFLAGDGVKHKDIIEKMSEKSYITSNYLTLLFIIHHTQDNQVIEDILVRTMCTLDNVSPAVLDKHETKEFRDIVADVPQEISRDGIEEERKKEREFRDIREREADAKNETREKGDEDIINDLYKILKNNQILAQVLRNKAGSLEKSKIKEIIETVSDGGLRLINLVLKDQEAIIEYMHYLKTKHPDADLDKIKKLLQEFSFLWTMINIEKIVGAVNYPKIREVVKEVVQQQKTAAYSLIGYFSHLDSAEEITNEVKQELDFLLKKYDDPFLKGVLSIRTWHYINTHQSKTPIEQSVCSLLGIKYTPRLRKKH